MKAATYEFVDIPLLSSYNSNMTYLSTMKQTDVDKYMYIFIYLQVSDK